MLWFPFYQQISIHVLVQFDLEQAYSAWIQVQKMHVSKGSGKRHPMVLGPSISILCDSISICPYGL